MSYSVDFKEIAQTPILSVAQMLGLDLTEAKTKIGEEFVPQFVGKCPISKGTNATAFKITPSRNRWICFCSSCKSLPKPGGDCVELVCRVRGIDRMAAAKEVRALSGDAAAPPEPEALARKAEGFNPLDYLKTLDVEHDALKDLDIDPATLVEWKAGYCSKGLNRGRLAIAWCGMDGVIKAFIGVALDDTIPRYVMPKGTPLPLWFGCHRVEEGDEPLRILPTIFDVLRAWENGVTNAICPVAPINGDSLTSLKALVDTKNLTVEI